MVVRGKCTCGDDRSIKLPCSVVHALLTRSGSLSSQKTTVSNAAWRRHFDVLSAAAKGTTSRLSNPLWTEQVRDTQLSTSVSFIPPAPMVGHSPHSMHRDHTSRVRDVKLVLAPAPEMVENYGNNYQTDRQQLLLNKHRNRTTFHAAATSNTTQSTSEHVAEYGFADMRLHLRQYMLRSIPRGRRMR